MLLETLPATQMVLAAIPEVATALTDAMAAISSTTAIAGAEVAAATTSDPSWADRLSASAAVVSAAAAWVTIGIAVLAVLYAARQVKEAQNQLEETRATRREQAQPYVVMYAEPSTVDPYVIELVIKNYGTTAAFGVAINLDSTPRRSGESLRREEVIDVVMPHVIPILAPGQEYRTQWDHAVLRRKVNPPQEHRGQLTYRDSRGEQLNSPVHLDWHNLTQRTWQHQSGLHEAAEALGQIRDRLARWEAPSGALAAVARDGHLLDEEEDVSVTATTSTSQRRCQDRQRRLQFVELRARRRTRRARGGR